MISTFWKASLLILICAVLAQGCITFNIPGLYSGYKKLDEAQKKQIVFLNETELIKDENDGNIHAITANNLLRTLQQNDTSLVYFWSPHCSSEVCIPISYVQQLCNQKQYDLYVVMDYYDDLAFRFIKDTQHPLLAINQLHYKTDVANKYGNLFKKELNTGKLLNKSDNFHRFVLFKPKLRNRI